MMYIFFNRGGQAGEQVNAFGWWWMVGTILTLAAGMGLYLLIKKNPRKDAND